jgi:type IV secretory pathway VirB4 component
MTDFKVDSEEIGMGDQHVKVYSLLDVDNVGLPGMIRPYSDTVVNNSVMPEDLLSELDHIPGVDTVIYNQVIFFPNQKREMAKLDKKKNRHASIPNPSNLIAVEDIKAVQDEVARNGKQLVYAHYNLVIKIEADKDFQKVTNNLENIFAKYSIHISKRAYNQLELFVASFPGNCFRLNQDYDQFLTISEAALCLMYKEHQAKGDNSPLKCYYTDRQGVPMPIDTTGKEGKVKYTNNSNFFVLGPSGSGKSFFMNTVMRQYYEQDTDIVIVDTGDSYEGLCSYFEGTYISYSKEKPISMNPFKITMLEYDQNFGEKKNFLKSLIFQIFKGAEMPSKIEDTIINQTIVEYFEAYFNPFEGFTDEERQKMKDTLLLQDKANS